MGKILVRMCYSHAILICALIDRPLVDREIESSTSEVDPFLIVVHVISIGSYVGTLLLNKKTMFPLKEQKLPVALNFFII